MALIFLCNPAKSEEFDPQIFAGKPEMTGYRWADFAGLEKTWQLVTVRYRKDTGELRFTYANDSAWKALLKGESDYPEGAVFAKIGFMTKEDPDFLSSAVPSGARRFQLMVRNKKKHAQTDGWGYALFDAKGLTFPEDPRIQVVACAACHRLVPQKGYVFSEPMNLSTAMSKELVSLNRGSANGLKFELTKISALDGMLQPELTGEAEEIYLLQGEMRKNLFQGTLDEIKPLLADKARESGKPAGLVSENKTRFSVVLPPKKDQSCPGGESVTYLSTTLNKKAPVSRFVSCAGSISP